jgi:hypothetical protein
MITKVTVTSNSLGPAVTTALAENLQLRAKVLEEYSFMEI